MKKMFALLVSMLAVAGMGLAAPIIGLTDRATGRGVPDADLRYLRIGVTNNVGTFSNLTVTTLLNLFGTAITNVDTNLVLYADGTQPMTGTGNGGGFGWTNLGTCLPGGSNTVDLGSLALPWRDIYLGTSSVWMAGVKMLSVSNGQLQVAYPIATTGGGTSTLGSVIGSGTLIYTNTGVAFGSTNTSLAKCYIKGEAGIYMALPLLYLDRSATGTGPILQWGTNGVPIGTIGIDGSISGRGPFTNSGTLALSAATTGSVSMAMMGNSWVFRKPYIYVTNTAFSAVGDWSWYSTSSFDSSSEQWRGNLEFASGTLTVPIGVGSNTVVVSDGTPFINGISVTPFQIVALGGTAELLTVTNVTGSTLYLSAVATGTHATNTVVSHACSWNVPGFLNDEAGGSTLRGKVRFPAAQTATFNYVVPYRRID